MNKKFYTIGHRGAAGLSAENTIPSILKALELEVDLIEIDVRQTLDNILVLLHDRTLDRTTAARGPVHRQYLAQLPDIPRLSDVLDIMVRSPSKVRLMIEIKDPQLYPGLVSELARLIQLYKMEDRVLICSFNKKVLQDIHKIVPALPIGLLTIGLPGWKSGSFIDYVCPFWLSALLSHANFASSRTTAIFCSHGRSTIGQS